MGGCWRPISVNRQRVSPADPMGGAWPSRRGRIARERGPGFVLRGPRHDLPENGLPGAGDIPGAAAWSGRGCGDDVRGDELTGADGRACISTLSSQTARLLTRRELTSKRGIDLQRPGRVPKH
jgi:hypothetical protein